MKLSTKYALLMFIVFRAANEVQGQNEENILGIKAVLNATRVKRQPEEFISNNKEFGSTFLENTSRNKCSSTYSTARPLTTKEIKTTYPKAAKISNYFKMLTKQNQSKAAKSINAESQNAVEQITISKPPVARFLPTQRIYCRQITKTEVNDEGKIVDSIQYVCAPLQTSTAPPTSTALPYLRRASNFSRRTTTTPRGINCRRVMNSELNDLGEIVDSVTEVCDPPTTTTTTTKKPILTTRFTTTTAKPLVKVCRPVMDSYLNEEGKIIDSVSIYCKMERVD